MTFLRMSALFCLLASMTSAAGAQEEGQRSAMIALIKMPYSGARNVPELSSTPSYLERGGLVEQLRAQGITLKPIEEIRLNAEEERDYGEWHRMGLANGHLAEAVATNARQGYVSVGLLANCTSLLGVLGGLQNSGPSRRPLRVGLVFIDSHGDFNTPETTLSGMLGGMPVAVAAGMALTNLRLKSGLDPAVPTRHIIMGGVRDTDPLEQDLLDRSEVRMLSVDDLRQRSARFHEQMRRLSDAVDVIYVHIDMDVLDPREVPGHPLTVADGPTSDELAAAIQEMFRYDKVGAFGVASTPPRERDPDGVSRRAAYKLIDAAVHGVLDRAADNSSR